MSTQSIGFPEDDTDLDGFVEVSEDSQGYSFAALLAQIVLHKDLILTIPADQEASLRKGLARRKARDNAKLTSAGLTPDNDVLSFLSYPHKDAAGTVVDGIVDVRVKLGPRRSVNVLDIRIPSNDF